ncbi:hypothetical protein T12_9937 [Trichinella patagoniensis]|uniref:Uncharacterized protein n=1 Tax=Trichinella patagoniensis TaxID=990121 RepID=A0A0V0YRA1_9BILA|nr:hypothetical protein T12_9937 [Trichinella patagoniensis]
MTHISFILCVFFALPRHELATLIKRTSATLFIA